MNIEEIWKITLDKVDKNISSQVGYNVHMKESSPVSVSNYIFTISVPTSISKNIIEHRYKKYIENALEEASNQKLSLNIVTEDEIKNKPSEQYTSQIIQNITDDFGVNPKYNFDSFVVGASNEFAFTAAKKAAEAPGQIYNPLFIYGNSGLGKTHLLHAIGNKIKENNPNSNIMYFSCEHFVNEFLVSLRENTTDKFKKKYRTADVLLVDDVQFIGNKDSSQEEFFHTFNELYNNNKQIVLTSDRKPNELTTLTDRLRTRFGQGLIIDISIPDYETRMAILQKKALSHNVEISYEIFDYIANNIRSSIRELEGALNSVISMSEIKSSVITLDFVKENLKSIIAGADAKKITPSIIIQRVSIYYNIPESEITGNIKTKEIALPRQVAMYICRKLLSLNDTTISREFGKDRTTVKHNIEKIEKEILTDDNLNSDINYIIKDIENM